MQHVRAKKGGRLESGGRSRERKASHNDIRKRAATAAGRQGGIVRREAETRGRRKQTPGAQLIAAAMRSAILLSGLGSAPASRNLLRIVTAIGRRSGESPIGLHKYRVVVVVEEERAPKVREEVVEVGSEEEVVPEKK